MIITCTPFRISFAGGGSDLPAFYQREEGAVLSTTIDKYMYIVLHPFFNKNKIQLKYSQTEQVDHIRDIQHPIFREVLSMYGVHGVDINSIADIPAGTGMGSSSSFTVGLLHSVQAYLGQASSKAQLAALASEIEIDRLGSPIGKQDQYAAAYGGLNFITFHADNTVKVENLSIAPETRKTLEENLLLIYIGGKHSATEILHRQSKNIAAPERFRAQQEMVALAHELKKSLCSQSLNDFGKILHEGWLLKRSLTNGISNSQIDQLYQRGLNAGALGGKLLGAGGAGFLLFYCEKEYQPALQTAMQPFESLPFCFDTQGTRIIYTGKKR